MNTIKHIDRAVSFMTTCYKLGLRKWPPGGIMTWSEAYKEVCDIYEEIHRGK